MAGGRAAGGRWCRPPCPVTAAAGSMALTNILLLLPTREEGGMKGPEQSELRQK